MYGVPSSFIHTSAHVQTVHANICKHIHLTVLHKEQVERKNSLGQISSGMAIPETELILSNVI